MAAYICQCWYNNQHYHFWIICCSFYHFAASLWCGRKLAPMTIALPFFICSVKSLFVSIYPFCFIYPILFTLDMFTLDMFTLDFFFVFCQLSIVGVRSPLFVRLTSSSLWEFVFPLVCVVFLLERRFHTHYLETPTTPTAHIHLQTTEGILVACNT